MPEPIAPIVVPTVTPPPTPPPPVVTPVPTIWEAFEEAFPGQKAIMMGAELSRYQASKRARELTEQIDKEQAAGRDLLLTSQIRAEGLISPYGMKALAEMQVESKVKVAAMQAERDKAENAMHCFIWRQDVALSLPFALTEPGNTVRSVDAARTRWVNNYMTPEDLQWLGDLYGKLEHLIPPKEIEILAKSPAAVRELLAAEPKAPVVSMHQLSVDAIVRALSATNLPALPPGLIGRDKDLLAIARDIDISPDSDFMKQITNLREFNEQRAKDWLTKSMNFELMKHGLIAAEAGELTAGQTFRMAMSQPWLLGVDTAEKYWNILCRPAAAWTLTRIPKRLQDELYLSSSPWIDDMRRVYAEYRELGEESWAAYSKAFEESEGNAFLKMITESFFDPTMLIGWGIVTRITKPLGYFGRFMGAMEKGWIEMWNIPFDGLRAAIRAAPKTPTMKAVLVGQQAFLDNSAFFDRFAGTINNNGLTLDQIRLAGNSAVEAFQAMPWAVERLDVRVGRNAFEHPFVSGEDILGWLKEMKVPAKVVDLTDRNIADVNFITDLFLKKAINRMEAGEMMTGVLLPAVSKAKLYLGPDLMPKLYQALDGWAAGIRDTALGLFDGASPEKILRSLEFRAREMALTKYNSRLFDFIVKDGSLTAWSRAIDRVLHWRLVAFIDRQVTAPMANQFLLFANYGPFNVLENCFRSITHGGELFYPKLSSPVDEICRLTSDLPNQIYEFTMYKSQMGRLEVSVTGLQTGAVTAFKGGRIPFITREVEVPLAVQEAFQKILPGAPEEVRLGAAELTMEGLFMNIGTTRYPIRSAQSWNDMYGDIGTKQRAYFVTKRYMENLTDLARDQMTQFADILTKHESILNEVAALSSREKKGLLRQLFQDMTLGPDAVKAHQVPLLDFERRLAWQKIAPTVNASTNIYQPQKLAIQDMALDGTIFVNTAEKFAALRASVREFDLSALQAYADSLDKMVASLASYTPANSEELVMTLGAIGDASRAMVESVADARQIVTIRAHELRGVEKDAFHRAAAENIGEVIDKSRKSVEAMLDNLMSNLQVAKGGVAELPISKAQQVSISNFSSATKIHQLNILAARDKDRAIMKEAIAKTPSAQRNDAWWDNIYAKREKEAWAPYRAIEDDLFNAEEDARLGVMHSFGFKEMPTNPAPTVVGPLTPSHVAYLMKTTGNDLNKALTQTGAMAKIRPKSRFVAWVYRRANKAAKDVGKTPEEIGFTKEAIGDVYDQMLGSSGLNPALANDPMLPSMLELKDIEGEVERVAAAGKLGHAADYTKYTDFLDKVASGMEGVAVEGKPTFPFIEGKLKPSADWNKLREQAMAQTRIDLDRAFTNYSDKSAVDAAMRAIFPFWTYEAQRWPWLAKTMLQKPGIATGLARYYDYTDQGYIRIPGTDIQFNPLRGTIFMGAFRRLALRDYPEYFDAIPGMEAYDYIQRLGFYPGVAFSIPINLWGTATGKPQWGELAPGWARSLMDTVLAAVPNSTAAKAITQQLFPERFRDYLTIMQLNSDKKEGIVLYDKMKANKLTAEEEKLWYDATRRVSGTLGVLFEQGAVFRFRPEDYAEFLQHSKQLITDMTGIPAEVQDAIQKQSAVTGMRLSDLYPLDPLQQRVVYMDEQFKRWQGMYSVLSPSSWQEMDKVIRSYYSDLEAVQTQYRRVGTVDSNGIPVPMSSITQINRALVGGLISPSQWDSMRRQITDSRSTAMETLSSTAYKDVPKTVEERAAFYLSRNAPIPTYHPGQELLQKYYELEPRMRWDVESGTYRRDFDTYYAEVEALIGALPEPFHQRLLDRIQVEWTPLERLHWQINQDYFRGYNAINNIWLDKYTPEQQRTIQRAATATGAERDQLREVLDPKTGRKLFAQYQSEVSAARTNLRQMSPDLDAWLAFFGTTTKILTRDADAKYQQLRKQYLVPAMVE